MASDAGLTGLFADDRSAAEAVRRLRAAGREDLQVYGPAPSHALEAALGPRRSVVGFFTFAGFLTGAAAGFSLAAHAAGRWGLIVSGKPVLSWIPFAVIAFELAVLGGALANFLSMVWFSGLGRFAAPPGYDPRFSRDRFGVFVNAPAADAGDVEALLRDAGAVEVVIPPPDEGSRNP